MPTKAWTEAFRKKAIKRIIEDESFLEACGITPVAGAELEFHYTQQQCDSAPKRLSDINEFASSGLVEALKEERIPQVGEIVMGKGPRSRNGTYPRERFPSTIARAVQSAKDIVGGGDGYGLVVEYGEKESGKRIRSLQNNISLWSTENKSPLFLNPPTLGEPWIFTNELTIECAKSLMQAQKALCALVSVNEPTFNRYKEKGVTFSTSFRNKVDSISVLLRQHKGGHPFVDSVVAKPTGKGAKESQPSSMYFEDRLASSEADPALSMLITLGGVVNGIKTYMRKKGFVDENNLPDPQKLKKHFSSPEFAESVKILPNGNVESSKDSGEFVPIVQPVDVPRTQQEAFAQFKNNDLAKELLGEDFYNKFCATYERENCSTRRR